MDKKILLQNVAESLAERTGLTKRKAEAFVRSFFDLTEEALIADGQVKVKSYGTTKVIKVNTRESVNINTGERFQIEGHAKISFTPDAPFRDLVNRPFAHFTTIILEDGVDDKEILPTAPDENGEAEEEEATSTPPTIEEKEDRAVKTTTEIRSAEAQLAPNNEATASAVAVHTEAPIDEAPANEAPVTTVHAQAETTDAANETAHTEAETAEEAFEEELIIEHGEEDLTAEERKEDAEAKSEAPIEALKDLEEEGDEDLQSADSQHTARKTHRSADDGNPPIIINNTIPTPLHNGWKTAFVILLTLILVLASYFAGYFRLFCPCNLFGTDAEEIECNVPAQTSEANTDSIQRADSLNKAKADSALNAAKRAEEQALAAQQAAQQAAMQQAAAQKAAQQAAAQQAAAQRAAQKELARQKELQAAQKYPQMTNSNYLITGVLRTRRIHKGENLYMIAKQTYGSKYFARYISFHNNIEDPNLVTEGQVIQIPRLTKR